MGLRNVKRQIAKARMTVMGVGNVNRKMKLKKDGVPNWKRALYGKTGIEAHNAQARHGIGSGKIKPVYIGKKG